MFNLLEGHCEVILANAQHMKAVPGHKTDIKDSEWIADLLRHGLLAASFIPPKPIRDLRDLLRTRKALVRTRAQAINRVHKVLETANIKLSSVASDVLGKSGRDMIDAMLAGVSDAETLAQFARKRLRAKLPAWRLGQGWHQATSRAQANANGLPRPKAIRLCRPCLLRWCGSSPIRRTITSQPSTIAWRIVLANCVPLWPSVTAFW